MGIFSRKSLNTYRAYHWGYDVGMRAFIYWSQPEAGFSAADFRVCLERAYWEEEIIMDRGSNLPANIEYAVQWYIKRFVELKMIVPQLGRRAARAAGGQQFNLTFSGFIARQVAVFEDGYRGSFYDKYDRIAAAIDAGTSIDFAESVTTEDHARMARVAYAHHYPSQATRGELQDGGLVKASKHPFTRVHHASFA